MSFVKPILGALSLSSLLLAGCDEQPHLVFEPRIADSGPQDDANVEVDAATLDGGLVDADVSDASAVADAAPDATTLDGAVIDGAVSDAALPDASTDAALADASTDGTVADAATDASSFDCIARDSAELTAKLLDVRCPRIDLVANTFEGNFVAARDVQLVGASRSTTILEGTDSSRNAVLTVAAGLTGVSAEALTVTGGVSGGISADSPIALTDVELHGNHGPSGGGGLLATSSVTITDSVIRDNTTSFAGAGVAVIGSGTQTVRVLNSSIRDNAVTTGDMGGAGGLAVVNVALLEIEDTTFEGNSVTARVTDEEGGGVGGGGAIFANVGTVRVTGSSFRSNTLTNEVGGGGAGFTLSSCPNATFEDVAVEDNVVDSHGETPGGAQVGNSIVTFRRTSFRRNKVRQDWATSSPATRYSIRGAGLATSNSEFLLEDVVIEDNVIELIDPPADITVHGAGAAFQAWSGDSTGVVRRTAIVGNRVDVTLTAIVPTFTAGNISGVGVWVVGDEEWSNTVSFINTTIGENECDLGAVRSSEVAMEASDQSRFTVYFANATIVGYLDQVALSSSISSESLVPSRVEFANTIVDNFVSAARCAFSELPETTAVSQGNNLVPASCVLPASWLGSDTELDGVTHAGIAARVPTPIPHYPLSFPSLALDGGRTLGCLEPGGALITSDILGTPRLGVCDVGAFEAVSIP